MSSLEEVFPRYTDKTETADKSETIVEKFAPVHIPPCDKLIDHVGRCRYCQRHLSFDPVEKALLKTHTLKNELLEVLLYIGMGILVIICLRMFVQWGESTSVSASTSTSNIT